MENLLKSDHAANQIIDTLRDYKLLKMDGYGYIPEYKRTDLTDLLHDKFAFNTDTQIVTPSAMRKIIANTKK